ncbi:MAG: C-GCAxxG-C-C family protein [Pseudomonadota bacterium]
MEKQEMAVAQFFGGYRCSQAVLEAFAPELGLDVDVARKISLGLAGGAGCGGECGAVEAAYLVNGLRFGFTHPGDSERFKKVIGKNGEFAARFKELHRSLNCQELIGVNLFTEEGFRNFQENDLKTKICAHLVGDAVKILEETGGET